MIGALSLLRLLELAPKSGCFLARLEVFNILDHTFGKSHVRLLSPFLQQKQLLHNRTAKFSHNFIKICVFIESALSSGHKFRYHYQLERFVRS